MSGNRLFSSSSMISLFYLILEGPRRAGTMRPRIVSLVLAFVRSAQPQATICLATYGPQSTRYLTPV